MGVSSVILLLLAAPAAGLVRRPTLPSRTSRSSSGGSSRGALFSTSLPDWIQDLESLPKEQDAWRFPDDEEESSIAAELTLSYDGFVARHTDVAIGVANALRDEEATAAAAAAAAAAATTAATASAAAGGRSVLRRLLAKSKESIAAVSVVKGPTTKAWLDDEPIPIATSSSSSSSYSSSSKSLKSYWPPTWEGAPSKMKSSPAAVISVVDDSAPVETTSISASSSPLFTFNTDTAVVDRVAKFLTSKSSASYWPPTWKGAPGEKNASPTTVASPAVKESIPDAATTASTSSPSSRSRSSSYWPATWRDAPSKTNASPVTSPAVKESIETVPAVKRSTTAVLVLKEEEARADAAAEAAADNATVEAAAVPEKCWDPSVAETALAEVVAVFEEATGLIVGTVTSPFATYRPPLSEASATRACLRDVPITALADAVEKFEASTGLVVDAIASEPSKASQPTRSAWRSVSLSVSVV
jgi:hypothetical protein